MNTIPRQRLRFFLALSAWTFSATMLMAADATGTTASRIVVDAYIDGPTELRVTPTGLYWIAKADKPGKHDGKDEPTFINEKAWKPVWGRPDQKGGPDKSQEFAFPCDPAKLKYKFVAATKERDGKNPLNRDAVITKMEGGEFSIFIPEGQAGACWYQFTLVKEPNLNAGARPFPGAKATPAR